jgi:hypothetical protein
MQFIFLQDSENRQHFINVEQIINIVLEMMENKLM